MPLTRGPDGSLGVRAMMPPVIQTNNNDQTAAEIRALRQEVAMLRKEQMAGHAAIASNTGKTTRILERVDNGDSLLVTTE